MKNILFALILLLAMLASASAQVPVPASTNQQPQAKISTVETKNQVSKKLYWGSWAVYSFGSGADIYTSTKLQPPYTVETNHLFAGSHGEFRAGRAVAFTAGFAGVTALIDRKSPKSAMVMRFALGGVRLFVAFHNHRLTQQYNPK